MATTKILRLLWAHKKTLCYWQEKQTGPEYVKKQLIKPSLPFEFAKLADNNDDSAYL